MHGIATMCRVLGVSPGGYYARQKRPPSARAQADEELSTRIAAIHRRSRQTYGVPRIYAELKAQGLRVGRKRVARLGSVRNFVCEQLVVNGCLTQQSPRATA